MTRTARPHPDDQREAPARSGSHARPGRDPRPEGNPRFTLAACFLGMFVVTLDAVVVNVALPSLRTDLHAGMTALQWVVDGYTLALAALLLTAGGLADRMGARRAFVIGMAGFTVASAACAMAPGAAELVAARVLQGAAASLLVPTSMSLIAHAFHDPRQRERAVGVWAMGGAVASSAGPVVGGALVAIDWRLVFLVNLPVGVIALLLARRAPVAPPREHPLDLPGLVLAATAMGSLTFAAVEAGPSGPFTLPVLVAGAVAISSSAGFLAVERRAAHPMLPLDLFRSREVSTVTVVGFSFMVAFYGTPFVMSLLLQDVRGLTAVGTGLVFLPMMVSGLVLTPFSARMVEALGRRSVVLIGLASIALGLVGLALVPATAPLWVVAALMLLVGLGGPTVMPPATAALLAAVPRELSGIGSGVLNTSRQVGGALAVAVFGALMSSPLGDVGGAHAALGAGAVLVVLTAAVAAVGLTARR